MSDVDSEFQRLMAHYKDKRSQKQKQITNILAEKLTELNLQRIKRFKNHLSEQFIYNQKDLQKYYNQKYLFVCIHGIPPFEKQFDHLYIPGQKLQIYIAGFQPELTQKQIEQKMQHADMQIQADLMHKKIIQKSMTKPLIFVYHSFGTFIASFYFQKYYQLQKDRIKGIIQLGPVPITAYELIKQGLRTAHLFERNTLIQNADFILQNFKKQMSKKKQKQGFTLLDYKSKYMIIIILLAYKSESMYKAFQFNRNLPKILKLFIYGSKDTMCEDTLLNEKAIYYAYNKDVKLNFKYQNDLIKQYENIHKKKIKNIQERFIFRLQGGNHSVHMQKKYTSDINLALKQYLQIIEKCE